ncbi:MAG TPA: acetyl/propionyl/methylcrotonyl-CoA carboxylase subunit alpha [Burkholderiaceae bacterium]|nr:acetyl/propionyl/methylcrotonyl-CoA carboxylase subunit alpha [Burkholderiaceae bacterium]
MFRKILIANRGEIACRVITTARKMGVRTVAVYSDADAGSRHVALADEAVRLGPAAAKDSYLRGDLILLAARDTGAQAVHPGYGFLSENESFAQACSDAGVVFIGPPPFAIHAMGSKSEAKSLMERAKVPLVPGYHGAKQEPTYLHAQADSIGYPVLIKASAGGGGKGMRVVTSTADFRPALESCQREARASFGDDRVLIEKYIERPRHIEIQIFADGVGNGVYLFERDCSVQRRHQKVIEEAPAPGMTPERRKAMGDAAVAAAQAVGYVGAGTVEFIADPHGHFFFMEMNTRLQVEHPVTEMITGHDLVEWQLRVAAGEPLTAMLPKLQESLEISGHAIEARVYAENPDKGFLPATGRLAHYATPAHVAFMRNMDGEPFHRPATVRIDSGVREGDEITPYYDPMIAKLIVWGEDRPQAIARMQEALGDMHIVGLANNVDFLSRLFANASFAAGELDTGLIERERDRLFAHDAHDERVGNELLAFACARVLADDARAETPDPWSSTQGWRLNTTYTRTLTFKSERGVHDVELEYARNGYRFRHAGADAALSVARAEGTRLAIAFGGRSLVADVVRQGDELHVFTRGRHRVLALVDIIAQSGEHEAGGGRLTAPMPGKVIALATHAGARVSRGTPLLVMEAMKMEHTIIAPADGVVGELLYAVGDQVAEGAELVRFEAE